MEGLGVAASVIAVVELSAKVTALCLEYSTAVANARADITRLQDQVKSLDTTLQHAGRLLKAHNSHLLSASSELDDPLQKCRGELERLRSKLELGSARKAMRRIGFRAIKWPFSRDDVETIITSLERYRNTIAFVLQIDQTNLLLGINKGIEDLSLQTVENPPISSKPHFILPFPRDPDFVDRPAIQTWIEEQYASLVSRIAIVGLGGFGKSQLAIEFAHNIHTTSPGTSIFWVHGGTKARFEESYRSIADTLMLPRRHDPNANVLKLVRDWLQREDVAPWLMILDNADDLNTCFSTSPNSSDDQELLASYLPKTSTGKILVTSRSLNVAEKLTGSYKAIQKIPTMESSQALKILRNKLTGPIDEGAAVNLIQALDFIPLAVNQAAAYINRRAPRVTISSYLDDFQRSEKKKTSLLNSDFGDLRRHESVSNSVVVTWQVTFEQIRQERPTAANVLALMSFFHPQNIPEHMLSVFRLAAPDCEGGNDDDDEDYLEDDLDILRAYSLVDLPAKPGFCEMHPLVQFCTQAWTSKFDTLLQFKSIFIRIISNYFPYGEFDTWPTCRMMLPHIQSVLREEPVEEADILAWADLLTNLSNYLNLTGDYDKAEDAAQKAVRARRRILGKEHPATLVSSARLASAFLNRGQFAKARLVETEMLEIRKRVQGEEHIETLVSMANLALVLEAQGQWAEAASLEVQVLEIQRRLLGEEHPQRLATMGNLAVALQKQGRLGEAELLGERVVEARERILGKEHPDTLVSMENLATIYWDQGRRAEFKSLGSQVLEIRKRLLGDEHPDTLTSMANLAMSFQEDEQWAESESLQIQALEMRKRILGEEHLHTLSSKSNLAMAYSNHGRWAEAEALEMELLEGLKDVLGEEHPQTLLVASNLAYTFIHQERWAEAAPLGAHVLELRRKVLGEDHPDTLVSISNLVFTLIQQKRWAEVEPLGVQALELRRRVLGENHPDALTSLHNMAFIHRALGRSEEALAMMRDCVDRRRRALGAEHPDTKGSEQALELWEQEG